MDHMQTIWIKKEEKDKICTERDSAFLEDPLRVSWCTECVNEEPGPHLTWAKAEDNFLEDPFRVSWCTECVNEKPGPHLAWAKAENNFLEDPLRVPWCTECINEKPGPHLVWDEAKNNILQAPLRASWCPERIDEKPELHFGWAKAESNNSVNKLLDVILEAEREGCPPLLVVPKKDVGSMECEMQNTKLVTSLLVPVIPKEEPGSMECEMQNTKLVTSLLVPVIPKEEPVVDPTTYASSRTRYIQSTGGNCSFEETVHQRVVTDELEIGAEKSTHVSMCDTCQDLMSQEDISSCTRYSCTSVQKKFHEFICSFCLHSFPSKYELIMHVFNHIDGVEPPIYVCKSCGEVFPNDISLNNHLNVSENTQILIAGDHDSQGSSDRHQAMVIIEGDISSRDEIKKRSSFQDIQKTAKNMFIGSSKTNTMIIAGKKPGIVGNYCHPSTAGHIKANAVLHATKRPFSCDICAKSFAQNSDLLKHIVMHIGVKPVNNNICSKASPQASGFNRREALPSGKKQYKCDICSKNFTQLLNLKGHALRHTGIRPYTCDICSKSFIQRCSLKVHTLIHKGELPHKCGICGKSFSQLSTLRRHSIIHTGKRTHKCDTCGKCFSHLVTLKNHDLTHTGNKPHRCDICGQSFGLISSLKRHAAIHSGKRPHICDICGKSFTQCCNLKRHTLIHNNNNNT